MFRHTSRLWFSAVGAAAVLALIVAADMKSFRTRAAEPTGIAGPNQLIEFSSVMTRTRPGGDTLTGRYFRGPDGSDRHESGPALDEIYFVEIKNIAQATYYTWDRRTPETWYAHPMQINGTQRRFARTMSRAQAKNAGPLYHEDFEVVELSGGGLTRHIAPALNFLDVDRVLPNGGRITHTNIRIGAVTQALASAPPVRTGPERDPLFE